MTLLHQAAQKAVEALKELRFVLDCALGMDCVRPSDANGPAVMADAAIAALQSALQHQEVPREPAELPAELFDGYAVYHALSPRARLRTSPENVSDVLDAVVHLTRAASPSTTRQQEVGSGAAFCPCSFCDSADACRERGCADAAYGREVAGRRAAAGGHTGDTERVRCVSCEWRGLVTDCAGFEQCDCPMCLAPVTDCPEAAPSTPENADGGPHG